MAYLQAANVFLGTAAGTLLAVFVLSGQVAGLDALLGIAAPSFAGAVTGASLGLFAGITGGMIGGMVGILFVLLPLGWLFIHAAISAFVAKIIVAMVLSWIVALLVPH